MNQTRDYITLKPIAERFKEVAATISDDKIKCLIKNELREQIMAQALVKENCPYLKVGERIPKLRTA